MKTNAIALCHNPDIRVVAIQEEFIVSAYQHSAKVRNYPNGIWYGTADGYCLTAPCSSQEMAVCEAKINLKKMVWWLESDITILRHAPMGTSEQQRLALLTSLLNKWNRIYNNPDVRY